MENTLNREMILDWYMDDVLNDRSLTNVYRFCEMHQISESDFYNHFSSLEKVEQYFFALLVEKTTDTLYHTEEYAKYTTEEQLLSFYYTFFSNMTANRSFVLHLIKDQNLHTLKKLSTLRSSFMAYIKTLDIEKLNWKQKDLNNIQNKAIEETAWLQLLATIKYWKEDDSPKFEKTDIFIEKALNAGFEIVNVQAFKKVMDFGKFLLKEIKK